MQVIRSSDELNRRLRPYRDSHKKVGFVPTMGYLHEGHLSLVRRSRKENRITVVSIFVNPLQFGPKEDLKRYPRNEKRDLAMLKKAKADFIFIPDPKKFYPEDFQTYAKVEGLSGPLCGKTRPIHFRGVATVVLKLLNIVRPDAVYLGQKDYQQFRVIEKMAEDLSLPVSVRMVPVVRERDGLAMSSRNIYLNAEERRQAPALHRALEAAAKAVKKGERSAEKLRKVMRESLRGAPRLRLDYLEIVDARTLRPVVKLTKDRRIAIALAGFFGKTRLIDNILVKV
jgi:pantoate--beta-alanine ligase